MQKLDIVKKLSLPTEAYFNYFQAMFSGAKIDYDEIIENALIKSN